MNPVCSQCHVEMRCYKNGVSVAPAQIEHHQYNGDEYKCPKCGIKIVTGFGQPNTNHNTQADLLLSEE